MQSDPKKQKRKTKQKQTPAQRPTQNQKPTPPDPKGILALLDSPESDDGVYAEARSYGPKGCDLLARAAMDDDLDAHRRARAVHLMGLLGCKELAKLAGKLMRNDAFSVRAASLYALVATDAALARQKLMPLIEDERADSLVREHAVHALWPALDEKDRLRVAKIVEGGDDDRLRQELEPWLLQVEAEQGRGGGIPADDPGRA